MQLDNAQLVSFFSVSEFKDHKHFPYGFRRSGEFTQQQSEALQQYGLAYQALALGERAPATAEESEFLRFCLGEKEASTLHEKTWKRYQAVCDKQAHRPSVSLSAAARENNAASHMDSDWDSM